MFYRLLRQMSAGTKMAWIDTDWNSELSQVKQLISEVIKEDVSPLLDNKLANVNQSFEHLLAKSAFYAESLSEDFFAELSKQRRLFVSDLIKLCLVFFAAFSLSTTLLMFLYFWLRNMY